MPIDPHHWSILICIKHIIYTLLNNQNVYQCSQKSVELIKESRYYVHSEDTFKESLTQVKIYVTWYRFKTQF